MKISGRELHQMHKDDEMLSAISAQGDGGRDTAKKYARTLRAKALRAMAKGHLSEAIWITERQAAFLCRTLGTRDPNSQQAMQELQTLRIQQTLGGEVETPGSCSRGVCQLMDWHPDTARSDW